MSYGPNVSLSEHTVPHTSDPLTNTYVPHRAKGLVVHGVRAGLLVPAHPQLACPASGSLGRVRFDSAVKGIRSVRHGMVRSTA